MSEPLSITVTEAPTTLGIGVGIPGPRGSVGPSMNVVTGEAPSGAINGSNAVFTLTHNPDGKLFIATKNGLSLDAGSTADYTWSGVTITFNAGAIPSGTDRIRVTYSF
jgi:hypothetical protein